MKYRRSEEKQEQIQWRRAKVLEFSSKGISEREIASLLQISAATAHRDITYLSHQAKENIGKYIVESLPAEYHRCLVGVTEIMKESWKTAEIAESEGNRRDKLQALALAKECYAMKLDLLSSATVIDRAIKFVDRNKGLIHQNNEVLIDDTAEPFENTG